MKILFTVANANLRGGTEFLAFHLLQELNVSGMDCRLLSVEPYHGDNPFVLSFSDKQYKEWTRLSENTLNKIMGNRYSDTYLSQLIAKKAEQLKAEWIINHTYDMCAAIPVDGRFKTAQVFNWSILGYERSLETIIRKKGFLGRILSMKGINAKKKLWHNALSRFTKLVVLTDAAHAEIKQVCPSVMNEQLVTISDPIVQKEESMVLTSLENKNLVFVGRLSHEKGVMRLLSIWERIIKVLPEYTLSIYGTGDARSEMENWLDAKNNKVKQSVKLKGFCNNLEQIYSNADLLLMTSESEGFGMVLIEAMYYGVPCISFDCPVSPKEIIADAGVTVPCYDEGQYANEVIKLLCDPKRMKILQVKAIKRAGDYYIDKVINLWKNMVQ